MKFDGSGVQVTNACVRKVLGWIDCQDVQHVLTLKKKVLLPDFTNLCVLHPNVDPDKRQRTKSVVTTAGNSFCGRQWPSRGPISNLLRASRDRRDVMISSGATSPLPGCPTPVGTDCNLNHSVGERGEVEGSWSRSALGPQQQAWGKVRFVSLRKARIRRMNRAV